ncbi:MAG TPA: hypothetical protein DDX91_05135, partial [Ruminococcaceae bacterium]|nr:hypothetical protein [Oscillospiraceae bacterium]
APRRKTVKAAVRAQLVKIIKSQRSKESQRSKKSQTQFKKPTQYPHRKVKKTIVKFIALGVEPISPKVLQFFQKCAII